MAGSKWTRLGVSGAIAGEIVASGGGKRGVESADEGKGGALASGVVVRPVRVVTPMRNVGFLTWMYMHSRSSNFS